jgi:phosphonate transport system ATP-binding protein
LLRLQEPEIVLADEPIASRDPHNTRVVMDALQRLNKHFGITVICNLHSLEIARSYCDRLVGMAAGAVVFDDVAAALTDRAARELYGAASDGSGRPDAAIADSGSPEGVVRQAAT